METLTLTLHKSKETKNKVVYGTGDGSVIQSVYIEQSWRGRFTKVRRYGGEGISVHRARTRWPFCDCPGTTIQVVR